MFPDSSSRWTKRDLLVIAFAEFALATTILSAEIAKPFAFDQQKNAAKAPIAGKGLNSSALPKGKRIVSKNEAVMKFFHLINMTGAEIKVRVIADDRELFVKSMQARIEKSEGIVHPAQDHYPALELKIPMSNQARQLTIHESLFLKKRKTVIVSARPGEADAGFQIVICRDGIKVTQDYYPMR